MKYFLFLIIVFNFCTVQAGFIEGMIVGSALTKKEKTVVEDEFSMQIKNMESALWKFQHPLTGENFRLMVPDSGAKYLAFFKNQGYSVQLEKNELIFDFKNEYQSYVINEQARHARQIKDQESFDNWWNNFKKTMTTWLILFGSLGFIGWCLYLFNAQEKHLSPYNRMVRQLCFSMVKQIKKK